MVQQRPEAFARAPQQNPLSAAHRTQRQEVAEQTTALDPTLDKIQLNELPSVLLNLELIIFKRVDCCVEQLSKENWPSRESRCTS
jgi:hypothetical protein